MLYELKISKGSPLLLETLLSVMVRNPRFNHVRVHELFYKKIKKQNNKTKKKKKSSKKQTDQIPFNLIYTKYHKFKCVFSI